MQKKKNEDDGGTTTAIEIKHKLDGPNRRGTQDEGVGRKRMYRKPLRKSADFQ